MAEASKSLGSVQFGPFELLLDTQELRKYGLPIKLSGQAIQVLIVLATRPGQLVTREELQRKLWPTDSFGDFEHGLNAAVNKLREKLGDSAITPTYVETLPGRGYRFIGVVGTLPNESPASPRAGDTQGLVGSEQPAMERAAEVTPPKSKRRLWPVAALALLAAAAGVAYWLFRPRTPVVTEIHQLTHTGHRKSLYPGGWLPATDGTRVYFHEYSDDKSHIAQVSTRGGEVSYLDTPELINPWPVDISPDGSTLLVANATTAGDYYFWLLPLPNGPPRRIPETAWGMAFLPGSNRIVYRKISDHKHLFTAKLDGSEAHTLMSVPGGTSLLYPEGIAPSVAISPDGERIRIVTTDNKAWEVHSDGTQAQRFLPEHQEVICCGHWSRDGRLYVFESRDQDGYSLWAVGESGALGHRFTSRPSRLTYGDISFRFPNPSNDGKQIFAVGKTLRGELSRYDTQSGQFSKYLNGISAGFTDFSHDGQWIAYVTHPQGMLWRSRIDGSESMQLTFPPMGSVLNPKWSPDGRFIVYTEWTDQVRKIFLISADGGVPMLLLSGDFQPADPTWSPDGKSIAYGGAATMLAPGVRTEVRILDLNTKQSRTIAGSQGMYSPRWAPDGRYIVAESEDGMRLLLYSFESDHWQELPLPSAGVGWPSWSHDGRYLYYMSGLSVYRASIPGGQSEQIANVAGIETACPAILWGSWFGLTADDHVLMLLDRTFEEIYALDLEYR